jgi:hypothetical protein
MHPWIISNVSVLVTSCGSAWISSVVPKDALSAVISCWGIGKVAGGGQANRGWGWEISVMFWEVRNCRTTKKPIVVLPLLWTFTPNALHQPLPNLTVKLALDDLTRRYEFVVDNSLDVEKMSTWT